MPAPADVEKRPITAEDLFALRLVSDPNMSPDRATVAYVVTSLDQERDSYRSALWLVGLAGGRPRQLTNGLHRDQAPRWSPDGSEIAFTSNRSGRVASADTDNSSSNADKAPAKDQAAVEKTEPQLWIISVDGGEARQLTALPNGAGEPAWSPDGDQIAFLAKTAPETTATLEIQADERIIDSIRYRADGSGFIDKHAHVWTIDAKGGDARQLTSGPYEDGHPTWASDGNSIYFISNRTDDHAINGRSLLYRVETGGGVPECVTDGAYRFESPVLSPDGHRIALLGNDDPVAGSAKNANLWTWDITSGHLQNHSARWDRSLGDYGMSDVSGPGEPVPTWADDGQGVFSLASDSGATNVYRIGLRDGQIEQVTHGARRVAGFGPAGEGRFVILSGDASHPFELYLAEGEEERPLTAHNAELMAEVHLAAAVELRTQSPGDGKDVQGWVLHPPGFDAGVGVKYPMILQIHGGPHAMYGQALFHEMQLMAARGYVVLFSNPRGSSGYGEEFTSCTRGTWGESDMPDVMAAVDAIVTAGYVDEDRMGVTGGSYGGYLTNWIIGHSDRFRAAVTQRCVADFVSFYGTSDIGFTFGEYEFDGTPWEQSERLRRHSPITYVEAMTTPLLIIHSERDLRCPIEQAEQLFTALRKLGREPIFVRIPEESHNLSRNGTPSRRLARLHHILAWFDQHL